MRRLASTLAAAFLLVARGSTAAPAQAYAPPSIEFRMDADRNISHERIRNTMLRTQFYNGDDAMLLVVEQDQWMDADEDGDDGQVRNSVRIQALGWDGAAFTRPLWTREERAHGWETVPAGYLRLTTLDCCPAERTHTLYDLDTGRLVAWYTGEPLVVMDLRARLLLVLYESPRSTHAPKGSGEGAVQGMLRIVRGTEVTDQVLVTGRDPDAEDGYAALIPAFCDAQGRPTLRQLSGGNDDISFNACFETEGRGWIVIPVRGGRFVLENARLPAGIGIRRGGW
jgi:hypothetical protein